MYPKSIYFGTLAPMYLYKEYFKASVYTIWAHRPLGKYPWGGIEASQNFAGCSMEFAAVFSITGGTTQAELRAVCVLEQAQRARYPLIKEYTLNYKGIHNMI